MNLFNRQQMIKLKERTKFYQGLVFGLFITSTLSYGVVTFSTFTSGTSISSSQMNANFATIKAKLDELDVGAVGSISSNAVITCATAVYTPSYPTDFTPINMTADYTDGNYAAGVYTIPSTGLYRLYLSAASEDTMGYTVSVELSTDGGSTWTQATSGSFSTELIKKFAAGNKIKVSAGCGDQQAGTDSTIDATKFVFAIKKY